MRDAQLSKSFPEKNVVKPPTIKERGIKNALRRPLWVTKGPSFLFRLRFGLLSETSSIKSYPS